MQELRSLRRIILIDDLGRRLSDEVSYELAGRGHPQLRPARWFALALIAHGEPSVAVLARWLGITRQSASELVDFAVREAYAERLPAGGSRRCIPVRLTEDGQAVVQAADRIAEEAIFRWSGAGSAGSPDRVFDVMARMVAFDSRRWLPWTQHHRNR